MSKSWGAVAPLPPLLLHHCGGSSATLAFQIMISILYWFCFHVNRETEYEYPMTAVSRAPPLPPPPHNRPGHAPVYEVIVEQQSSSDAAPTFSLTGSSPSSAGLTPSSDGPTLHWLAPPLH